MRCILCLRFTLGGICGQCQKSLLKPSLFKRKLPSGLTVYSFYPYNEIENLLLTKHTDIGAKVYKQIARAITPAVLKLLDSDSSLVAIEGKKLSPYSHTAVLINELKRVHKNALKGALIDKSSRKYSGKSLAYRVKNPRDFELKKVQKLSKSVVLLDDIVTTGLTLQNAAQKLSENGFSVKFAITLADAKNLS